MKISDATFDTRPKRFVLVLMPFSRESDELYLKGIRPAAEESGGYCERVDEQHFDGSIAARIANQINKADVIVAVMSSRNPNVFYEVGYAHALGKLVVLMTDDSESIPFDLRDRPHIVYQRPTDALRQLVKKLTWAFEHQQSLPFANSTDGLRVYCKKQGINEVSHRLGLISNGGAVQSVLVKLRHANEEPALHFAIANEGSQAIPSLDGVHLLFSQPSKLRFLVRDADGTKTLLLPTGRSPQISNRQCSEIVLAFPRDALVADKCIGIDLSIQMSRLMDEILCLRVLVAGLTLDFGFTLQA